ncbi:MEF2-activating motif and SAP domain-containing transcriptional regulator isoform X4 [Manis javanica]|uniref:MEF2-activating motif and SAP domain-containing transcriptional regulator isoform X4 n=1 Tax=Manis javanica TaxID=9974 RepID=UPI003C6D6E14
MTLAASSQRSQIIRSKFRSVLQLRIHRRYQDPSLSGSFSASPASDPDPWISASGPALGPRAQAPALPSSPTPFLISPGVSLPELEYGPWRSLKDSPKISQHSKEPKPKGNLTYHQYMPPEPRQGSRADPQAEGSALGLPGPSLWEGTQQPPHRMKPTPPAPSPLGVPSPSPPPHKLELQTLKLEELTVWLSPPPGSPPSTASPRPSPPTPGLRAPAAAALAGPPGVGDQVDAPGAHARRRPDPRAVETAARGQSPGRSVAAPQAQGSGSRPEAGLGQAEAGISPAASSTRRGNPGDCSGSRSGSESSSSGDPFLSTSRGGPDSGGGASGSDPQSTVASEPGHR